MIAGTLVGSRFRRSIFSAMVSHFFAKSMYLMRIAGRSVSSAAIRQATALLRYAFTLALGRGIGVEPQMEPHNDRGGQLSRSGLNTSGREKPWMQRSRSASVPDRNYARSGLPSSWRRLHQSPAALLVSKVLASASLSRVADPRGG